MKSLITILFCAALLLTACNLPEGNLTPTEESFVEPPASETFTPPPPTDTKIPSPTWTSTASPEPPTLTPRTFPTAQPLTSGEPITLTQIQMYSLKSGWGVGHTKTSGAHMVYTEDGGVTWDDRTPPEIIADQPGEIKSAMSHFLDPNTAWVIYSPQNAPPPFKGNLVWRTSNAGLSWEPGPDLDVDGMEAFFVPGGFASVGQDYGWLLVHIGAGMSHDYSYLYRTTDAGLTWEKIVDPTTDGGIQSLRNTGIAFADAQYGWVTKDNLGVLPGAFFEQTTDGGITWEKVSLPAPPELDWFNEMSLCETSAPTFTGDHTGHVIVKCRLPEDIQSADKWSLTYIYTTPDRGVTWTHAKLPSPIHQLNFFTENYGWAFGRDFFHTIDGGATWEKLKTVFWDGDFSQIDPQNNWAVARNEGEIALVATKDGGQTWEMFEPVVR